MTIKRMIAAKVGFITLLFGFAAPSMADPVTITELIVNRSVIAGSYYTVGVRYKKSGPILFKPRKICLYYSGEGPFCKHVTRVDARSKIVEAQAYTGRSNTYLLTGYLVYIVKGVSGEKKSNRVSTRITVK